MSRLEAGQLVPMTVLVDDTTACEPVSSGARGIAVVDLGGRASSDTLQLVAGWRLAATSVDGEVARTEAHVAPPRVAVWVGLLEAGCFVPHPGVVLDSACHGASPSVTGHLTRTERHVA